MEGHAEEGESRVLLESSGEAAATGRGDGDGDVGGGGGVESNNSGEDQDFKGSSRGDEVVDKNGGGYGGNRWPRQETLALLKIRSDMDAIFKDSNLKGPLWEEISRKLGDLGYSRSAKKCKEKFENVYKYHKRTKEGRNGKPDGKTYRFFDQLEALENQPQPPSLPPLTKAQPLAAVRPWPPPLTTTPPVSQNFIITSVTAPFLTNPTIIVPPLSSTPNPPNSLPGGNNNNGNNNKKKTIRNTFVFSSSTSSSTASDEEFGGVGQRKRKRKWKNFFVRLTKEVMEKQEGLQMKFLETLEKIEVQRMEREEAWRQQEMARVNREHESFVQERSNAAAKDAAVIALLQKISGGTQVVSGIAQPLPPPALRPLNHPPPPPPPQPHPPSIPTANLDFQKLDHCNGGKDDNAVPTSSSRWPKAEVEALINLRTGLDLKYQENVPKGPLWEEISAGMRKLGYNRSSKRCKEKWENINKYFKKVKESNKKRPEDSKTCPYFHHLNALYREKSKNDHVSSSLPTIQMEPLMVQPEQQWPLPRAVNHSKPEVEVEVEVEVVERVNGEHSRDEEEEDLEEQDDDEEIDGESDQEEDEGSFELVTNKQESAALMGVVQ